MKTVGPFQLIGLVVLFCFSLFGCHSEKNKIAGKDVVVVNSHRLNTKEFALILGRKLKDLDAISAKDALVIKSAKEEIVKSFILRSLIVDWSKTKNIVVSDGDLDAEVQRIRSTYPDDLSFRRSLARENISFAEWKESLRFNLLEKKFFENFRAEIPAPKEADIKSYFDENRSFFKKKERIYLRQIVVDDESKAELLKTEAKKGNFGELAKKYSSSPEANKDGVVGWVEKGTLEAFDAAFSLPIGSVSQPVKSPFGYHIMKVEKKLPESSGTLDEARPQIIARLNANREQSIFVKWLDGQIRSSKVMKDEALIQALTIETKVQNE